MRIRSGAAAALVISIVCIAAIVVPGPGGVRMVAADGERLTYEAHYTYVVDPDAGAVHVVADITLTNVVPNRSDSRGVLKTYYTGFGMPLPDESVNVVASQDGTPVTVTHGDESTGHLYTGDIDFARDLFYKQHALVHVTYDLTASAPRADEPTRSNAAYVAFDAFGYADPGRLGLDVAVPSSFEASTLGDTMDRRTDGDDVVFTATGFDDDGSFSSFVIARRDDHLVTEQHDQAGAKFVVRSWPDDTAWTAFVDDHIDRGVPALSALIGQPWPVDVAVDITEAATNKFSGYAGYYDARNKELEIGEELDANTMLHELSHAWFSGDWFTGRWIDEGLAQEYADLADQQFGAAALAPDAVAEADRSPLNSWVVPPDATTDEGQRTERIGYNSSWYVVDQLVDSLGQDKMRDVFAATARKEIAYIGDAPPETVVGVADWKRLLDDLQQREGSTTAEDLFRTYVVTDDQRADLDRRDAARTAYAALVESGNGWAAPVIVRRSMSAWEFDDATSEMQDAGAALTARDALTSTLTPLGVTIDPTIESTYESEIADFDATNAAIAAQRSTADMVVTTHDRAVAAVTTQGITPTPALEATLRAGTTLASEQAAAEDVIAAAASVQRAADAVALPRSWIDRVGLYGKDVDAAMRTARDALAAGDTAGARTGAADAQAMLAEAHGLGRHRVLVTALVAGGVLLLLIVVVVLLVVRRRRRRRASIADATPEADPVAAPDTEPVVEPGVVPEDEPATEPDDDAGVGLPDLSAPVPDQ